MFDQKPTIDTEDVFKLIRDESEFCSRCGGKLDLMYGNWHLPFCTSCRIEIMAGLKDEKIKLLDELEKNTTVRRADKPSKKPFAFLIKKKARKRRSKRQK